jgi:hypothetical protein
MRALIALLLLLPGLALAAPKAEPWPRWEAHDPAATLQVDHSAWTALLARHLRLGEDGIARFDYRDADRAAVDAYVAMLSAQPVDRLNRAAQKAYWINLYNAVTVQTVLKHYPVKSIRDIRISPGLFASGPWGRKLVTVAGEPLSLDDIEHRILRPIWRDPRVHYAVNCASLGCPNLAAEAYTPENLERLLEAGARAYINHPRGASVAGGKLTVSSIYVWFGDDFGDVLTHLRRYADAPLAMALQGVSRIADDRYDWALNE